MAKNYRKGDLYRLYLNTAAYATPTWAHIKAVDDLALDPQMGDIEVPERGIHTGHLQGKGDILFTFTLMEDAGDANVETLIQALLTDTTMVHLAIARADIATSGTVYWHAECVLFGGLSANLGDVASYDIEARRHANSDNDLKRATTT